MEHPCRSVATPTHSPYILVGLPAEGSPSQGLDLAYSVHEMGFEGCADACSDFYYVGKAGLTFKKPLGFGVICSWQMGKIRLELKGSS